MERYLGQCLDSVLAQDSPSTYEIILVDNGSTDGTGAICDSYAERYSCVRLLRIKENKGGPRGTNAGCSIAQGIYVFYLDSDDLWEPNFLSTMDTLSENQPDMLFFWYERFSETEQLKKTNVFCSVIPKGESGREWINRLSAIKDSPNSSLWTYGWKRSFIEQFQLYPNPEFSIGGDTELVLRGLIAAESIQGTNCVLYRYRIRADSVMHQVSPENFMDSLIAMEKLFNRFPDYVLADGYCLRAAQVACLGSRERERQCIQFIKSHWDIWKHIQFKRTKIARLLLRTFGIHNGSSIWLTIRRAKYWITRKTDTVYPKF